MKLTMEMLAQQLAEKDIYPHLNEYSGKMYRGVRNFKTENAFYVDGDGDNSYIYGESEDSYILVKKCSVSDAMNAVMDIFDNLNEKFEELVHALQNKDYQRVVDICFELLKNPVFIMSASSKLIAINSQTRAEDLDNPEWKHLYKYGYSSVENYQRFKGMLRKHELNFNTKPVLYSSPPTSDRTSFIVTMLCCDKTIFGRITVMEYFKKFSNGDYDFLELIANIISDYMKITSISVPEIKHSDIIAKLIDDKDISEEEAKRIKDYLGWQSGDMHRVLVVGCKYSLEQIKLVKEYIDNFFPDYPSSIYNNDIVIILKDNKTQPLRTIENRILNSYLMKLNLTFGFSLKFSDLCKLKCYYEQALYAISEGKNKPVNFFYDYGVKFILNSQNEEAKFKACHPDVLKLVGNFGGVESEIMNTLYCYLANERNLIKTSEKLSIHRNTLIYRVNKLKDAMEYDINEPYTREYIYLSLMLMKNCSYEF